MKYLTLLALANAIKISDEETCSSTAQAYLVQNGLKVEALAQVDAEVDEKFTFGGDGLIDANSKVAGDLLQIGKTIGVSKIGGKANWGTMAGDVDLDLYVFLDTILTKLTTAHLAAVAN